MSSPSSATVTQYSGCINGKYRKLGGLTGQVSPLDPPRYVDDGRENLLRVAARVSRPIAACVLIQQNARKTYRYLAILATILCRRTYADFAVETTVDTVFVMLKVLRFTTPEVGQPQSDFLAQLLQLVGDLREADRSEERESLRTMIVDLLDKNCSLLQS